MTNVRRQLRVAASIEDKQSFSIPRLAPERQFEIGELYLFHRKNSRCPSISSLWGIFNGYKEGRLSLESSSHNLRSFRHWHILPEEYRYCRCASRHELRDYISGLIYNVIPVYPPTCILPQRILLCQGRGSDATHCRRKGQSSAPSVFLWGVKIGFYAGNQHKSLCHTVKKSYICFA